MGWGGGSFIYNKIIIKDKVKTSFLLEQRFPVRLISSHLIRPFRQISVHSAASFSPNLSAAGPLAWPDKNILTQKWS